MSPATKTIVVSASLGFFLGAAGLLFWEATRASIGGWAALGVYALVAAGAFVVRERLSRRHVGSTVLAYFIAVATAVALHTGALSYSMSARSAAISAASLD